MTRFGADVRLLRRRKGWSQRRLAAEAKVGRWVVLAIESGRGDRIRPALLAAVVVALGGRVSIRVLYQGEGLDRLRDQRHAALVEAIVRRFGPVSRARIHELSQIRLSATSTLVRSLLEEGRLLESGVEDSAVGRKTVLLSLNESYGSVAGIEFDDEALSVGVSDLHPRIQHLLTVPVPLDGGQEKLIRQLLSVTRRALQEARVSKRNLIGIGVADPGLVDRQQGVTLTSSTIPFWRQVPLREIFEREFGVPVLVETRTRAKAVAEHAAEGGDGARSSLVYVDYGSGIGAGPRPGSWMTCRSTPSRATVNWRKRLRRASCARQSYRSRQCRTSAFM